MDNTIRFTAALSALSTTIQKYFRQAGTGRAEEEDSLDEEDDLPLNEILLTNVDANIIRSDITSGEEISDAPARKKTRAQMTKTEMKNVPTAKEVSEGVKNEC